MWDGLLSMTVGEPLDVKACGNLSEHWVPLIAIDACSSNLLGYNIAEFFLETLNGDQEEVFTLPVFAKSLGPRWSH